MEKIQSRVQDVRTEDGCALVSSGSWTPSEMDSLNSPTHGTDSKRLIVFVSMEMDQGMELARRVQWQALNQNRSVLYITLVENMDQELAADRWLAALKAATHGSTLRVDTRVAVIGEWMQALRLAYRPGDVILCHAEQEMRDHFLHTRPVSEVIADQLGAPVSPLSGYYHPERTALGFWIRHLLFVLGIILILVGFTVFEIQADHSIQGAIRPAVLVFFFVGELMALWGWNKAMG